MTIWNVISVSDYVRNYKIQNSFCYMRSSRLSSAAKEMFSNHWKQYKIVFQRTKTSLMGSSLLDNIKYKKLVLIDCVSKPFRTKISIVWKLVWVYFSFEVSIIFNKCQSIISSSYKYKLDILNMFIKMIMYTKVFTVRGVFYDPYYSKYMLRNTDIRLKYWLNQ